MVMRRAAVLLIALATDVGLAWLLWRVLAPGGWTAAKLTMAVAFAGTAPWTGLCAANGIIGFVLSVLRPPFPATLPRGEADSWPLPRIAIAVTVRDEDMGRVLPALRRLLHGLDLAGAGDAFGVFILSDSQHGAVEERAVASFRADDRDPARIHYRRRLSNIGFKAGNIMDFLDHDAHGYELMLTLDADSEMSAAAVLRLIRLMQVEPTLAVAQHLTVGLPASSAFPRLFQFGMRAGMRIWATGLAWWQGDEGPYWGHNAVVRIAPFRRHCRLPTLPNGRHILSHDQVEAGLLSGAGWGVRVIADEEGSWEANPPALPEFLRRETRWACRQYAVLAPAAFAWRKRNGALAADPGDPALCGSTDVPGVPACRGDSGRHRRCVSVSCPVGPGADRGMVGRALCTEAARLRGGRIVARKACSPWWAGSFRPRCGQRDRFHAVA